jgi:hypothetical protein
MKSAIILVLVFGEFSLAATVTVFFIYTAELLPTVLRCGVWWVRGLSGNRKMTR